MYNNKSNSKVEGTPEFIQITTFYKLFESDDIDFKEAYSQRNPSFMLAAYSLMLAKVRPFILQYIKSPEARKEILVNDIEKKFDELRQGNSDYDQKHNSKIYSEMIRLLFKKYMKLYHYIALANLLLRFTKPDDRPAALMNDDE